MKITLKILEDYYNKGLLIKQIHPTLPLTIWNYSKTVQFEGVWDDILLSCRGLVTDDKGNVVAKPFPKFFNIGEGKHTPTSLFTVFEKLDGSLGLSFFYDNQWVFASRGSFTSDQAIKGKEIFDRLEKYSLFEDCTYIWEIIYPENRIVVDYGNQERLVLLGIIQTTTGLELSLNGIRKNGNYDVVKEYEGINTLDDFHYLKRKYEDKKIEGFVIKFENGERVKVKYDEYVRLHKLISQISTKAVWECLMNGDSMEDFLSEIPDEFYPKVKQYRDRLIMAYELHREKIRTELKKIIFSLGNDVDDKTFAKFVSSHPDKKLLFAMKNNKIKVLNKLIWDGLRPEFKML